MTSTESGSGYRSEGEYRDRDRGSPAGRRGRGIFISTEARPGFITSEFWLTLIGVAAMMILAFAVDEVGDRWGLTLATAILVAYILSRGIAKAGSSDIMRSDLD